MGSGTPFDPVGKPGGLTDTDTPGTYTYYAECSTALGCRTATTFVINPTPAAPAVTGAAICTGYTALLSASGAATGEQYKWYDAASGGLLLKTSTNDTDNTFTTDVLIATTNYWVAVINSFGCEGARSQVTATVQPVPSLTIGDVTSGEADGNAVFTVSLSAPAACDVTFDVNTADVTALAGTDFSALISAPYTILAGSTSVTISVPLTDDNLVEPSETFHVNLSNAVNSTIGDGQALGTITDNDVASLSINDVIVDEADGNAIFTVTLTGDIQDALAVDFITSNVTALAGSDYTSTSGTLTFIAGSLNGSTMSVTVPITNDAISEVTTETFNVTLSNLISTGSASISDPLGVGTITDNDASSVAVNDVTVDEAAGNAVFTVTLTGAIQDALTVDYTTGDVTALAGSDYTTAANT
ncbi:MAG: hypothetical protein IPJ37_03000 [Bacteroidales bacterium]|nr:hypothetical protein [Bacteroidales bacterium]